MTVLWATSELTGINSAAAGGGAAIANGACRSGYARMGLSATSNGLSATDPPTYRFQSLPFTAGNLVWVHAQVYESQTSPVANAQVVRVLSPDGQARVLIRDTATFGVFKLSTRTAAGVITDVGSSFSAALAGSAITALDIKIDYSASGGATVWLGGTQVFTYTGDLRTDSATQLNAVEFSNIAFSSVTNWAELIVADEDTRGWALWTLVPAASGNTQSWTPNTVGNINESNPSDATYVLTTTNNALSEWTVSSSVPSGTWEVKAFEQVARVLVSPAGPQHFDWLVRTASTDYLAGTSIAPTGGFLNYNRMWPTNPNTGLAWAPTDFTAAGFNSGLKSLA